MTSRSEDLEFVHTELVYIKGRIDVLQNICLQTKGVTHLHLPLVFLGSLIDKLTRFVQNPNAVKENGFKDTPCPDPLMLVSESDEGIVSPEPVPVRGVPVPETGGSRGAHGADGAPLEPVKDDPLLQLEEGENKVGWHRPMPKRLQEAIVKEYESGNHRTLISIASHFKKYKVGVWRIRNLLVSRGLYEARRTDRIGPEKKKASRVLSLCGWNILKISKALSVSQPTVIEYLAETQEEPTRSVQTDSEGVMTVVPFKGRKVQ